MPSVSESLSAKGDCISPLPGSLTSRVEERIARHRSERGLEWETVEEPVNIAKTISGSSLYDVIVIDCLTLWLCNLVHESGFGDKETIPEMDARGRLQDKETAIIAVSNELGFGVIPDNPPVEKIFRFSGDHEPEDGKGGRQGLC